MILSVAAISRMEVYEPVKIRDPRKILDAVSKGDVNAGYSTGSYCQAEIPTAQFFAAVIFGPESGGHLAWL